IRTQDGRPSQRVATFAYSPLPVKDLSHWRDPYQEALNRVQAEGERLFDLTTGPLFRFRLLVLGADDHVLFVTIHHIIFDGWSLTVFCRELSEFYQSYLDGRPSLPSELPMQYTDYVVGQRQRLQGKLLDEQLSYWKRQLAGAPAVLELPADRP